MWPAPTTATVNRIWLPFRARLEPLVHPEVLLGHLAHALLDEGEHAPGVGRIVAARKAGPRRIEARDVSAAGQHAGHTGHHLGASDARNIRQSYGGGRGHAEERHEDRGPGPE